MATVLVVQETDVTPRAAFGDVELTFPTIDDARAYIAAKARSHTDTGWVPVVNLPDEFTANKVYLEPSIDGVTRKSRSFKRTA